jgi:transcriptional regulator NrdR family protein
VDRSPGYRKEFSASQLSQLKTLRAVYLTDQKKKALFSFEVSERNREEAVTAISNELESQGFSAVAASDVQSTILEQLN